MEALGEFFKWAVSNVGLAWALFLGAVAVITYMGMTWLPSRLYEYERKQNGDALDSVLKVAEKTYDLLCSMDRRIGGGRG